MEIQTSCLIAQGMRIEGKITGDANVRINGDVKGEIDIESVLNIACDGMVEAEVKAARVIVEGQLTGDVKATEMIQLSAKARVKGSLAAPAIPIEKGAKFSGSMDMG